MDDKQYRIVRQGLENLYHICKDDGDGDLIDAITELESSLMTQFGKHEYKRNEMLNRIHNYYYDCIGEHPTDEQVSEIAPEIEKELQYEIDQWLCDDTEIGNRIWNWINENIKHW